MWPRGFVYGGAYAANGLLGVASVAVWGLARLCVCNCVCGEYDFLQYAQLHLLKCQLVFTYTEQILKFVAGLDCKNAT